MDDNEMYDKMRRMAEVNRQEEPNKKKRLAERSKVKLAEVIQKKFKTTFIGAISAFEEEFGFIWGHDKDERDLTPREKEWKEIWKKVRNKILNNGNEQARSVINELQQYYVEWQAYHRDLPIRSQE